MARRTRRGRGGSGQIIHDPVDPLPLTRPLAPEMGSAKTTGGNTPLFSDSVFCSTSDSSDHEPETLPVKLLSPNQCPQRASNSTTIIHAWTSPDDRRFSTIRPQLSSTRSHTDLRSREASHSPVDGMVASCARSRSGEDILSLGRAGGLLPDASTSHEEDQLHGLYRTRRETLTHLPPPSTEPRVSTSGARVGGPGTAQNGRIGSESVGLVMSGIAPIDKTLTSETSLATTPKPNRSAPSIPGLGQSVPATAEISRVAVVATTSLGEDSHDAPPTGARPKAT